MTSVALCRRTEDKERERSRNCGLPEGGWRVAEHALFELAIMECWFLYDYKTCKDNKKIVIIKQHIECLLGAILFFC